MPEMPESRASRAPPALVLGAGLTALGVVRALGRAGIEALVPASAGELATRSRYGRVLLTLEANASEAKPESQNPVEALLRKASGFGGIESAVLIPCSDSSARGIAELPASLARRFPASIASRDALETLIDKSRFAAFLAARDLPHPRTLPIEDESTLEEADADLFEHAFLKPTDSQRFFQRFGQKAFWVRSRDDALHRFREIRDAGHAVVLQEYVPGPPSAHVFLDGFVDRTGTVTHLLARRRLRMYPPPFGNSSLMVTIAATEVPEAVRDLRRVLADLSYRGIFSAELKLDARSGRFHFLEINARAWWYVEFTATCGVNVCEAAYRDALGLAPRPPTAVRTGIRCVYAELDFAARRPHMSADGRPVEATSAEANGGSILRWIRPWIGARRPILAWDDPAPAFWDARRIVARRLRSMVRP